MLDFGIAKSLEDSKEQKLTTPGMAMGTCRNTWREQAAGKGADARADVYSLGAIMHEMLSGKAPIAGENMMDILIRKATEDPEDIASRRPDVPAPRWRSLSCGCCRVPSMRVRRAWPTPQRKCRKSSATSVPGCCWCRRGPAQQVSDGHSDGQAGFQSTTDDAGGWRGALQAVCLGLQVRCIGCSPPRCKTHPDAGAVKLVTPPVVDAGIKPGGGNEPPVSPPDAGTPTKPPQVATETNPGKTPVPPKKDRDDGDGKPGKLGN